jgi:hypothetical protein
VDDARFVLRAEERPFRLRGIDLYGDAAPPRLPGRESGVLEELEPPEDFPALRAKRPLEIADRDAEGVPEHQGATCQKEEDAGRAIRI